MADDPLEEEFIHICKMYKILYTRPEREPENPSNLDFYLPHYNLFVGVKQFHTYRLCKQIEGHGKVMALIGKESVRAFGMMIKDARQNV